MKGNDAFSAMFQQVCIAQPEDRTDKFSKVLEKIKDGMKIRFTPKNVAPWDRFLIFSAYKSCVVTFHTNVVPYWVEFDNDEPMRLEDCPESFFDSILMNIK